MSRELHVPYIFTTGASGWVVIEEVAKNCMHFLFLTGWLNNLMPSNIMG